MRPRVASVLMVERLAHGDSTRGRPLVAILLMQAATRAEASDSVELRRWWGVRSQMPPAVQATARLDSLTFLIGEERILLRWPPVVRHWLIMGERHRILTFIVGRCAAASIRVLQVLVGGREGPSGPASLVAWSAVISMPTAPGAGCQDAIRVITVSLGGLGHEALSSGWKQGRADSGGLWAHVML